VVYQLGSGLDERSALSVEQDCPRFTLTLEGGEEVRFRTVVVAAGIGPLEKKLSVFEGFSSSHVSHCYEGRNLRKFAGKRVAVIGGGQSALESAALLHEAQAEVEVIARQSRINWIGQHSWLHHLGPISSMLYSSHDVGPAGISKLVAVNWKAPA
jgi:FAD-dependent urate hydroxylase